MSGWQGRYAGASFGYPSGVRDGRDRPRTWDARVPQLSAQLTDTHSRRAGSTSVQAAPGPPYSSYEGLQGSLRAPSVPSSLHKKAGLRFHALKNGLVVGRRDFSRNF